MFVNRQQRIFWKRLGIKKVHPFWAQSMIHQW